MVDHVNAAISDMVKNFKSTSYEYRRGKRSFSSSSISEATPIKKAKNGESRLNVSYVSSPTETRRMRTDLLEARNTIQSLEKTIARLHTVDKERQLIFDEENSTLKRQNEYSKATIEKLEDQLQNIRKREIELKNKLCELTEKYELLKLQSEGDINKLERAMSEFKEETHQAAFDKNIIIPSLERKINELETVAKAAREDAEAHKKLAEELGSKLSRDNALEKDISLKEQELLKAKLYIKELEHTQKNFEEFQKLAKDQETKFLRCVELEKENEGLKEENNRLKELIKDKLILEEQVWDLKSRLDKFKECEKKLGELQIEATQNAMDLNEWRAVARGVFESVESDVILRQKLRDVVERLQQQEVRLTTEKVELDSRLKEVTYEAKLAKSEVEKSKVLINELKQTSEQKQKLIHRLEKKLTLVIHERDSYRLQLDSYEKDLTIYSISTTNLGGSAQSQLQSQKERIDNLEKIVDEYRDVVAKLENELQTSQPLAYADTTPLKKEQITKLKDELNHLRLENEQLRQRRNELEIQLESFMEGQDTLHGGQIMHQAVNPLSECLAQRENEMEKLKQEIQRLKRKVKSLEEGMETSNTGNLTVNSEEISALKKQLQSHESQTQKLKDYFKSQMQEFRNIIYRLFGYKIDRTTSGLYKLRSMYADNQDDLLGFQVSREGDLNLIENEFTSSVENMIDLHLRHQKSIPVFLSALTMDLFNSQTMTATNYE